MNRQEASLFFRLRVVPCSPVPPNKPMQRSGLRPAADRQRRWPRFKEALYGGITAFRDDFRLDGVNSYVTSENLDPDYLDAACEGFLWGVYLSSIPIPLLYPGFFISTAAVCWGIRGHRAYYRIMETAPHTY
jgi:hypothetical protein